jgi:hypothetical protein
VLFYSIPNSQREPSSFLVNGEDKARQGATLNMQHIHDKLTISRKLRKGD